MFKLFVEGLSAAAIEAPYAHLEKPMGIARFDAIESSQISFGSRSF
jgi:hypothetical protein